MKHLPCYLTLIICSITLSVTAQDHMFPEIPHVRTGAKYTQEVVPDLIYLGIELSEKDSKGKISIEAIEQQMISTLKGLAINTDKQLSVSDISSNFKRYLLRKKDIHKVKNFTLELYDASTMSQVVQALEQRNIANIDIQRVEYSKMEELKIELRSKAIIKAKRQAEALVAPLNQTLGKVLHISDNNVEISLYQNSNSRGMAYDYSSNSSYEISPSDFEELRVTIYVAVYFELL